jgi:hypothetical protein
MTTDTRASYDKSNCRRKDFRRLFEASQPLFANCLTKDGSFKERIQNLSSKGAFLATRRKFTIGDEIAMTIPLVHTKAIFKATGEIIRLDEAGVGVEFRVVFKY